MKTLSPAHRANIAKSMIGNTNGKGNLGFRHSEAAKRKRKANAIGKLGAPFGKRKTKSIKLPDY